MRGSRKIRQGGVSLGQSDKKSSYNVFFLVLSLLEFKWSISKKFIIFQGSRGGSNFFQGGGGGGPIAYSL